MNISFYHFFLFFFSSQFLILPKCPHFCSHIFWRTEPCERQSPLLKQIQTSIKLHMACLPVSDRWCRCTFERAEPEQHSTAGKTMRTGGKQDCTLHLLNKTGTRTTMSRDQFNMATWHPQYWNMTYSMQCYLYHVCAQKWAAYKNPSHFLLQQ